MTLVTSQKQIDDEEAETRGDRRCAALGGEHDRHGEAAREKAREGEDLPVVIAEIEVDRSRDEHRDRQVDREDGRQCWPRREWRGIARKITSDAGASARRRTVIGRLLQVCATLATTAPNMQQPRLARQQLSLCRTRGEYRG